MIYKHSKSVFRFYLITSLFLCLFLIGIPFLVVCLTWYFNESLEIGKDGVIIRKGWIFKRSREIPYNKINSIEITKFLGIGGIEIACANITQPDVFNSVDNPNQIKEEIKKHTTHT